MAKKIMLASAFLLSSTANAVLIDQDTFRQNGGDVSNVRASIRTVNEKLRAFSYAKPWLTVGNIGNCTATWIGSKDFWSYFLTAAHCVGYQGSETQISKTFKAWNGEVIASGAGTAYVPRERLNIPAGLGGASTDIAILRLPSRNILKDQAGVPVERPILNDSLFEQGKPVIFVGYGAWGVGLDGAGGYWPENGARRLYGRSAVNRIFESGYGFGAHYKPTGPSPYWARLAPGDSGSAWWQFHQTKPVIIATTNGGTSTDSTGARVSKYVSWIRSVYPEARFLSEVRPKGCIVSQKTGAKYCLETGQQSENGLPEWIKGHDVRVQADSGVSVVLSDRDNLADNRLAEFAGTVESGRLRRVKAYNGEYLNFSTPSSMRVQANTRPLGCIVSMISGDKYCLPAGERSGYSLPVWIRRHEVYVQADAGTAVMLSDWDNLSYNRLAVFSGVVENQDLKRVKASNGQDIDFSRPRSMRVVQH